MSTISTVSLTENKKMGYKQSQFFQLSKGKKLEALIGISLSELDHLLKAKNRYHIHRIDNKRWIEAPCPQLKQVQRAIHNDLRKLKLPSYVYTFNSSIKNAARHYGNHKLATLDISQFFPSTHSGRIFNFFKERMQCIPHISGLLTKTCTFNRGHENIGHLPTGAPSSPILSFWAYKDLWDRINELAESHGCLFTLYMDDLAISGPNVTPALIDKICHLIQKKGFKVHSLKKKYYLEDEDKIITGIILEKDGKFNALPEAYEKASMLRDLLQGTDDEKEAECLAAKLQGIEQYNTQVRNQELILNPSCIR